MADPRIRLVFNPRAGSGAAARRLPHLVDALQQFDLPFEIARTACPGDATNIARRSFDDGIDLLAVVGGDGTLNEVVQAYIDDRGEPVPGPELALIPIGTGSDTRRTLQLTGDLKNSVSKLRDGKSFPYDLASMRLVDFDDRETFKAFVNITSFGIGGLTDKFVNETPKWLGGKATFFIGSFRAMLQYRNEHVIVEVDAQPFLDGPAFNVALANGRFFGGGMMIAPDANPSDGLLDVVSLGDFRRLEALLLSRKVYDGTHVELPKVTTVRGARIEALPKSKTQNVLLDMDGETPGKLPISVRVLPGALRVRA